MAPGLACDVAVVGGGLGGLAVAAGLSARGYNARLYEAAPALRTATGTLVSLGNNSFNALERIRPGLVPELRSLGSWRTKTVNYLRASKDKPPKVTDMPWNADSLLTIRWSEVQRVLSNHLPQDIINPLHRAVGYTEGHDSVTVHFKDQPDVRARFVVAADGLRSALRATMIPNDPGPRYLGTMGWNALLYNPDSSVVPGLGPGEGHVWTNHGEWDGGNLHCLVLDAGQGYTYLAIALYSPQPSFTLPEGGTTHIPESSDKTPNLIWGRLGKPGSKARVLKMLEDAGFEQPYQMLQAIPESDFFERATLDRVPLDELIGRMSSPGGRVVLLGDAAHAMCSGPGQGARSAFEDADTLVAAFEKHKSKLTDWEFTGTNYTTSSTSSDGHSSDHSEIIIPRDAAGLKAVVKDYEDARLIRTCRIQRFSAENVGLQSIRDALRPPGLSLEERTQRSAEFYKWVAQYPDNPQGDPTSHYWKPPSARDTTATSSKVQPAAANKSTAAAAS